jgi:hypothetical protein
MILDKLIDRAGNSNPQIFRELKERLTIRNIGITVIATLLIQVFVLLFFNAQVPVPVYQTNNAASSIVETHHTYCDISADPDYSQVNFHSSHDDTFCKLSESGGFKINWQKWRSDIFICLSWILPLGLILGSVYLLVADLLQEEKRGTLNFIRLSPQSAQQIFIGKILGVPVLVYLAAILMLPIHLWMGLNGGGNLLFLTGWYTAIGSLWFLFASAAVLYVLLGGIQAILTVIAIGYPICLPLLAINLFASATLDRQQWLNSGNASIYWFGIPIAGSAIAFYIFGTCCCLVASYWIWQALERRYLNPTATIIGKNQSYLMNLCLQVSIAGFTVSSITHNYYDKSIFVGMAFMDFMALLLLIPMLLPSKQALQDWSRYRRERVTHQRRLFSQRELVKDLIGNDKSPALLAIAINIGIAMVLWLPLSIFVGSLSVSVRFLSGICLGASLILIYAAIAHLGLFLNVRKRNLWIAAIVSVVAILPIVGAGVLSSASTPTGFAAILLLFSPLAPMGILQLAGWSILGTFAAQLAVFAVLTHQLQRKLQISGRSLSKEFAPSSSV